MRKEWTSKEVTYLENSYDKRGVPFIAKKLNRSEVSIKRKAQSLSLNAYSGDKLYLRTFARCFDCDSRVINRWISDYGLQFSKVIRGQATCKLIDTEQFWIWAEEHQDLIPWNKYESGSLLPEPNWAKQKLKTYAYKNNRKSITRYDINSVVFLRKKGYTFPQIANELGRTLDSVKHIWRKYNKSKQK